MKRNWAMWTEAWLMNYWLFSMTLGKGATSAREFDNQKNLMQAGVLLNSNTMLSE